MKKVLFVSRDSSVETNGGTLVSQRNERLLKKLGYSTNRFVIPQPSMPTRIHNFLFKEGYGETKSLKQAYIHELSKDYEFIFFDGSIYGGFINIAKSFGKKIVCFYHNVEYSYYSQKARISRKLLDRAFVKFIYRNEAIATINADMIITLTERDSKGLKKIYNRGADIIVPTSFEARNIESLYKDRNQNNSPYLLFVGSNFFANKEGIEYFINYIAPKINYKVKIVGNIKDAFVSKSSIPPNIEFLGKVDSLDDLYVNAVAVVAPILSGSGLKTKTAEALSYGKTVIGTEEAFSGIDLQYFPKAGTIAKDATDFVTAIAELNPNHVLNQSALDLFHKHLSDDVYLSKLSRTISSLI